MHHVVLMSAMLSVATGTSPRAHSSASEGGITVKIPAADDVTVAVCDERGEYPSEVRAVNRTAQEVFYPGLVPGNWTVLARRRGRGDWAHAQVSLEAGGHPTVQAAFDGKPLRCVGTVIDAKTKKPLAGAVVETLGAVLFRNGRHACAIGLAQAVTDPDGRFTLAGLSAGRRVLYVRDDGYRGRDALVELTRDGADCGTILLRSESEPPMSIAYPHPGFDVEPDHRGARIQYITADVARRLAVGELILAVDGRSVVGFTQGELKAALDVDRPVTLRVEGTDGKRRDVKLARH